MLFLIDQLFFVQEGGALDEKRELVIGCQVGAELLKELLKEFLCDRIGGAVGSIRFGSFIQQLEDTLD